MKKIGKQSYKCEICGAIKSYELFKMRTNEMICHECKIKQLQNLNRSGKIKIKKSIDYFWVYNNLIKTGICCIGFLLFDELCTIDKRFLRAKKIISSGADWGTGDAYLVYNGGLFK